MKKITKHYLENQNTQETVLDGKVKDVFIFSTNIENIENFCSDLSKKIDSDVYWYKINDKAMVCVPKKSANAAIKVGKQIIIDTFDNISTKYVSKGIIPVLEDYSIIATVESDNLEGLKFWCKEIDSNENLIVKTKEQGLLCIITLTQIVDDFKKRILDEYLKNSFKAEFDFTYKKI